MRTVSDVAAALAIVALAVLTAILVLSVHACSAVHPLPVADGAWCVNATAGEHVWRGSVEYQCPEDPTAYPSDPPDYYQLRRRRDGGAR